MKVFLDKKAFMSFRVLSIHGYVANVNKNIRRTQVTRIVYTWDAHRNDLRSENLFVYQVRNEPLI